MRIGLHAEGLIFTLDPRAKAFVRRFPRESGEIRVAPLGGGSWAVTVLLAGEQVAPAARARIIDSPVEALAAAVKVSREGSAALAHYGKPALEVTVAEPPAPP